MSAADGEEGAAGDGGGGCGAPVGGEGGGGAPPLGGKTGGMGHEAGGIGEPIGRGIGEPLGLNSLKGVARRELERRTFAGKNLCCLTRVYPRRTLASARRAPGWSSTAAPTAPIRWCTSSSTWCVDFGTKS